LVVPGGILATISYLSESIQAGPDLLLIIIESEGTEQEVTEDGACI
jgi:hypothetical protein